ncbi:MAG: sulfatase-like hydrolase/transferase [Bacteroidales bacterium]
MSRILTSGIIALVFGLFHGCGSEGTKSISDKKPNIIFIFADDQCYSTIHTLGNNEIKTPNLDKLAQAGVTFTHAYNMGAWGGAVCVASRAMLNTGKFIWRAHAVEDSQQEIVERGEMWGQLMKKAGYDTYMTGKWHVRTDAKDHFEHVVHVRPGMPGDAWNSHFFYICQPMLPIKPGNMFRSDINRYIKTLIPTTGSGYTGG